MPRYRLTIEYDGTPFVGWQRQANGQSVQGAIEDALLALTGESAPVRGAGRTDAGVHASGQVAHFDLAASFTVEKIPDALNAHLRPAPVAILAAATVPDGFDARFSAIGRRYRYRIANRRAPLALERDRAWRVARPLDENAMREAAAALIGTHDFTTFRAVECQAKSPVKTLRELTVTRSGEEISIEAEARSFLHSQIRSIAGSLKLVGEGKWRPADVATALAARDRSACGALAPPSGLYLMAVAYPGQDG
jgi:tRNA pseudouridine38-40 synthase